MDAVIRGFYTSLLIGVADGGFGSRGFGLW